MNFFQRLFGGGASGPSVPQGHGVRIMPQAAREIKRQIGLQGLSVAQVTLVIDRGDNGHFSMDVTDRPHIRTSPTHALANCHGLIVAVPHHLVEPLSDLVVHLSQGGFRFEGSAAGASHPGKVSLSRAKLLAIAPDYPKSRIQELERHLLEGDSRAAVVVTTQPLVVAAYTDELDAVALVTFPDMLVNLHGLQRASRLLTVNMYQFGRDIAPDLCEGERTTHRFGNFAPAIADFVTDDLGRIQTRKKEIDEAEWQRTAMLAARAFQTARGRYRSGFPPVSWKAAY